MPGQPDDATIPEAAIRGQDATFLAAIVSSSFEPIVSKTLDGTVTSWNAAATRLFGYSEQEMVGHSIRCIIPPGRQEEEDNILASIAAGQCLEPFETVRLSKDGNQIDVAVTVSPIRDASGKIIGASNIVRDISGSKKALALLRENETRLTLFIEHAPAAIAMFDREMRYLAASKRWRLDYGLSQDLAGRSHYEIFPEISEHWKQAHRRGLAGETLCSEGERFRRANGSEQWIKWELRPWRNSEGDVRGIIIATEDITERKAAEERLRESEARLQAVLNSSPDPIFLKDREGRLVISNPAAYAAVGKPAEACLGKTDEQFFDNPTEGRAIEDTDRRIMASGRAETIEEAISTASGTRYYVSNKAPFRDAAGNIIGLIGTARDVTERKQSDERIQFLIREVNHRSKNMLTLVQAIARQTVAATPEDFLNRFGERLQALAASQDLLVKHGWSGVNLEDLVRFQLAPFSDLIDSRIKLRGPQCSISASGAQALGMALHELATNAGKYGALSDPKGRVNVSWHLGKQAADIDEFVMSWAESGGPAVKKPVRRGFGSTVISSLTEDSLNGKVELDYAPAGLSWRVTCPAQEIIEGSRTEALPRAVPASSPHHERGRILVVEDEALVAMEVAQVLTEAGFAVVGPARGVAEALWVLERDGCDAAVLDVNLGHETSEPVALELTKRRTPFVRLSGHSQAQQASAFNGAAVLTKPIRPELLVAAIVECLDKSVHDQ